MMMDGTAAEYPVYIEDADIVADVKGGAVRASDVIVYRGILAAIVTLFVDEDGDEHAELLVVMPTRGFMYEGVQ